MNLAFRLAVYQSCCCSSYSLCNDCSFTIAGVVSGPSLLSAGAVSCTCGTIGDFAIDWRVGSVDGPITLTSGAGTDPDIQTTHPFTNEPVLAGDIYPTIRYIWIDGIRYTTIDNEEGTLTEPIICITPENAPVAALSCSTSYNADAYYDFIFTYNAITSGTDKSREFKFDLSPTTNYLAWGFTGFTVTDGLEMFYCTASDPVGTQIENWQIGQALTGTTNYTTNPQRLASTQQQRCVSNLTGFTYAAGDYIRIDITGSILDPSNTNTNWVIKCKCLETPNCDQCGCVGEGCYELTRQVDISSITMTWDATACEYLLDYSLQGSCPNIMSATFFRYIGTGDVPVTGLGFAPVTSPSGLLPTSPYSQLTSPLVRLRLLYNTIGSQTNVVTSSASFTGLAGQMTFAKSGTTLTFSFTDNVDYNYYKTELQTRIAGVTGFVNDNTQVGYYQMFQISAPITITSCGDNQTIRTFNWHVDSATSFDDGLRTITITLNVPAIGIVDSDCSTVYEVALSLVNQMTNSSTGTSTPNFSQTTVCRRNPNNFSYVKLTTTVNAQTQRTESVRYTITPELIDGICDMEAAGFCFTTASWNLYKYHDRFTLTDPTDHTSRLNNYRLERATAFLNGTQCSGTPTYDLVYEVAGGVQVFP